MRAEMRTALGQVIFYIQPDQRKIYGTVEDQKLTKKLIERGFTEVKPYGDFRFEGDDGQNIANRLNEFITEIKVISAEEKVERLIWEEPILCILSRHNVEIRHDEDEDEEEA